MGRCAQRCRAPAILSGGRRCRESCSRGRCDESVGIGLLFWLVTDFVAIVLCRSPRLHRPRSSRAHTCWVERRPPVHQRWHASQPAGNLQQIPADRRGRQRAPKIAIEPKMVEILLAASGQVLLAANMIQPTRQKLSAINANWRVFSTCHCSAISAEKWINTRYWQVAETRCL